MNFLKKKYNLVHISTGDVFRFNIKNKMKIMEHTFYQIETASIIKTENFSEILINLVWKILMTQIYPV